MFVDDSMNTREMLGTVTIQNLYCVGIILMEVKVIIGYKHMVSLNTAPRIVFVSMDNSATG
jgi:hypothetical protein